MLSLKYTNPNYCSLSAPHPILWTAGSNPHEVTKASIQSKMISGQYRTAMVSRHWSTNRKGWCCSPYCIEIEETLEHFLIWFLLFNTARSTILRLWQGVADPDILELVTSVLRGPADILLRFILDASTHPTTISIGQMQGPELLCVIFHLTRTWCFSLHKERLNLRGKFSFT